VASRKPAVLKKNNWLRSWLYIEAVELAVQPALQQVVQLE